MSEVADMVLMELEEKMEQSAEKNDYESAAKFKTEVEQTKAKIKQLLKKGFFCDIMAIN